VSKLELTVGQASASECEQVLANACECEKVCFERVRESASQRVDKRERASAKDFWRARTSARGCELYRVRDSASQGRASERVRACERVLASSSAARGCTWQQL